MSNYQNPFPDEDFSQANGCRGKRSYPSKRQANGKLRVIRQKGAAGPTLGAYGCRECGKWHLGNSRRRELEQ